MQGSSGLIQGPSGFMQGPSGSQGSLPRKDPSWSQKRSNLKSPHQEIGKVFGYKRRQLSTLVPAKKTAKALYWKKLTTLLTSTQQDVCPNTAEKIKLASKGMANVELTFEIDGDVNVYCPECPPGGMSRKN